MKNYEIPSLGIWIIVILSLFLGIMIGVAINSAIHPNYITQGTANDICVNFTGISGTYGNTTYDGKLICEVPTFDHTTNIQIVKVGEGN